MIMSELKYDWSVSFKTAVNKEKMKICEIISSESNLEFFHPFCKINRAKIWSQENSVDELEYLNGLIFYRQFTNWKYGKGYDLYIKQTDKEKSSFVQWRLLAIKDKTQIKIKIFPYLFKQCNRLINFIPFHIIVKPLLKSYLRSVVGGLKLYAEKNIIVPKNYFGKHIWFSRF